MPLFIGFVTSGIPLGVTFSFLVSVPMVNEVALVLLFGLFGWKIAALHAGTGLVIAMISGWLIGGLGMEKHVEEWVYAMPTGGVGPDGSRELSWPDRIHHGTEAVRDIIGKVWPWVIAGIAVGAVIHGYVPGILRKVLMVRLIAAFAGIVGAGILVVGYLTGKKTVFQCSAPSPALRPVCAWPA